MRTKPRRRLLTVASNQFSRALKVWLGEHPVAVHIGVDERRCAGINRH